MSERAETPFDNIESSHEFVALLGEAIDVAIAEVTTDLNELIASNGDERRKQAFQLVLFKLQRLRTNIASSRRILNDLRTLRRLLLDERSSTKTRAAHGS